MWRVLNMVGTLHYVLWEISYLNLSMMLVDAVSIDYDASSDKTPFDQSKDANDPENFNNQDEIVAR